MAAMLYVCKKMTGNQGWVFPFIKDKTGRKAQLSLRLEKLEPPPPPSFYSTSRMFEAISTYFPLSFLLGYALVVVMWSKASEIFKMSSTFILV